MTNQLKNPNFWALVLFAGGMIIGGWGWDKYESTLPERTQGSVFMMVAGGVMIVAGLLVWAINSFRKK